MDNFLQVSNSFIELFVPVTTPSSFICSLSEFIPCTCKPTEFVMARIKTFHFFIRSVRMNFPLDLPFALIKFSIFSSDLSVALISSSIFKHSVTASSLSRDVLSRMLPSALLSPSLSFFSRAFQSLFLLQCCFLLLFSCHLTPFLGSRGTSCLVVSMSFFQLSPILLLLFVCHNWHWLYFRWLFSCTLSCSSTLCDSCSYLRWRSCNSHSILSMKMYSENSVFPPLMVLQFSSMANAKMLSWNSCSLMDWWAVRTCHWNLVDLYNLSLF